MSRAYLAIFLVSSLGAQTQGNVFEKAPPDVDEALRGRIAKFYQAHVDKKFREADQYVAEDTKDFFYSVNKPAYFSFRIDQITYSENFTKASVVTLCKQLIMSPGFKDPVDLPTPSTWKLENGQWFWFFDQQRRQTPFGVATPTTKNTGSGSGALPTSIPASIEELWKSVQADKNRVDLNLKQSSADQVLIGNRMPGVITLHVEGPKIPGLKVALDRDEVKPNEEAKLNFSFDPAKDSVARTVEVRVVIDSLLGRVIPIQVRIR